MISEQKQMRCSECNEEMEQTLKMDKCIELLVSYCNNPKCKKFTKGPSGVLE